MKKYLISILSLCVATIASAQVSFGDAALFNEDWLFSLSDDSLARQPQYVADASWRKLTLPHDWSIEGEAQKSLASCTGYLPGGIGWYRKHFEWHAAEQSAQTARQYIYFEGVYNRSEVYLNGHLLGKRPSGFASFCYELTPWLVEGENVLSVRVDHSRYADSRWYTGSGIYRDVWLVKAPEAHLAQWGTGYECTSLSNNEATVQVQVAIENIKRLRKPQLLVEWLDAQGNVVAQAQIKAKESNLITLKVVDPHRWDLSDPYLYTLRTSLLSGTERVDGCELKAGLRSLEFDANKGFALNGRWLKVKGVCLHHDAGALGAVVPRDVWRRKLEQLKGIGTNAVRCAHNPMPPVLYELCDELGLLVMDEASDEWEFPKRKWVEGWNVGKPSFDGTHDFFEEWIDRDVTDMVRRDRHHPSIILWSIGNEVDYPNDPYSHPVLDGNNAAISQPMFGGYDPKRPNAERIGIIAKRLAACVRAVDKSRPVTGALAGVVMSNQTAYPEAVDVVGYNYTEKRYDEDHKTYPTRVIYGSENGVGYDAWKSVRDKEFIFGQFIWTGTDYLGESGRWPSRGLHTGLLDFGSFRKPRGWFRAAMWSESPVCYIGTYIHREQRGRGRNRNRLSAEALDTWNYAEGDTVRVVCYTNAAQARLLLNGQEVGAVKPHDDRQGIIYWDVPYQPGLLVAEAQDAQGVKVADYEIPTHGEAVAIRLTTDVSVLPAEQRVAHITVEVVDAEGRRVKTSRHNLNLQIDGPARLLGFDNSDNGDMSSHRDNQELAFQGRALAYVESVGQSGTLTVTVSAEGLPAQQLQLEVK